MYGRGTSDDKGPAMSAFYALCALKDNGLLEGFRIRLVIGGNEEKGSRCLEHYFKVLHKEYPDYGFTPDGEFPLIYGEKGICNFLVKDTIDLYPIISINAGVAGNAVIDKAECVLAEDSSIDEALKNTTLKYSIEHRKDDMTLIIFGKSAHGSTPELGINAGLLMMEFISNYYDLDELKRLSSLFKEPNGSSMGAYYFSELLHGTTYNVGIIKYNNLNFEMTVNFRYPENVNPHEVIKNIGNMTDPFTTIAMGASAPLLFDPLSPMIRGLLSVYQEESGDLVTPIMTIGGGTYAKESKNTIAFGSAFPNLDCHIHDADEFITLHDFNLSMAIYAHAIIKLGKEL